MRLKIAIITNSLVKGGLERSCANLSILLTENGFDVHTITLNSGIDYTIKGQLFDLGIYKNGKNDHLLKRIFRFRKMRKYMKKEKFDFIIDNRTSSELFRELFYRLYLFRKTKVIYLQHSYHIATHFPKKSIATRYLIKRAYAIRAVSDGTSKKFNTRYNTLKCETMYNFIQPLEETNEKELYPKNFILFLGRLHNQSKNFYLLLEAYKKSKLPENNIQLVIMGDGQDKHQIKEKINNLHLNHFVELRGFNSFVKQPLTECLFLVLSSNYEGFPMTLIEALSCGTPVVSVDCKSGPSEIIQHEQNGLLVENHNPEALAKAMNRMIEDNVLYNRCKANAQKSVTHLSKDEIGKQWESLLTVD